jgi:hypothetical protein
MVLHNVIKIFLATFSATYSFPQNFSFITELNWKWHELLAEMWQRTGLENNKMKCKQNFHDDICLVIEKLFIL